MVGWLSNFYIFDGIMKLTHQKAQIWFFRVSAVVEGFKVYYQGKEVTDDMELLIATNKITKPTQANKGVENRWYLRAL